MAITICFLFLITFMVFLMYRIYRLVCEIEEKELRLKTAHNNYTNEVNRRIDREKELKRVGEELTELKAKYNTVMDRTGLPTSWWIMPVATQQTE